MTTERPHAESGLGSGLGFSELVPRYVLIEDAVRGQRVLEVGSVEPEGLLRLAAAGAAKVTATVERAERHDRARLRARRIELVTMDVGQLDFDDHSFDVVLVPDLLSSLAANPDVLRELRRVLAPDGFGLLGFEAAGRPLGQLFGGRASSILRGDPRRVLESIRGVFGRAKLFRQTPFVGVAFLAEATSADAGLSLG
jgi:SAM-dependent methyltransferase